MHANEPKFRYRLGDNTRKGVIDTVFPPISGAVFILLG